MEGDPSPQLKNYKSSRAWDSFDCGPSPKWLKVPLRNHIVSLQDLHSVPNQ